MILVGQLCLLFSFVALGFAAYACLLGAFRGLPRLTKIGRHCAAAGVFTLTVVVVVLVTALLLKDFQLSYVAQYSSRELAWYYSVSALWVGQAGSLLLWTWMLGSLSLVFRLAHRSHPAALMDAALGILMAFCCFLAGTMVFAADPMEFNIAGGEKGAGLSPLLHHPAMMIHPPIVFLGYSFWAIPCALVIASLCAYGGNSAAQNRSAEFVGLWVRIAQPWILMAWTILGGGILLGAYWSYEELGWGGYWAWDPVENGSLIPWLVGSALVHSLMAWKHCRILKKTTIGLSIACFALCNFSTFLTRSGIFSSLHAFSESPIGWLFLGLMLSLTVLGLALIVYRREPLRAGGAITSLWTREALIVIAIVALLLLATVTLLGTISVAISEFVIGRRVTVGPMFYNYTLIPVSLVLLATMSTAPVFRWRVAPSRREKTVFLAAAAFALVPLVIAGILGVRQPLAFAVIWLSAGVTITHLAPVFVPHWPGQQRGTGIRWWNRLLFNRRMHSSYLIHLGFVALVVGVTGSSLGSRSQEIVLARGERVGWEDRSVRFKELVQRESREKLVVEAIIEVTQGHNAPVQLRPAQEYHRLQNQWTTEVAIHSTWRGDFYIVMQADADAESVRLTLIDNPLMRLIWLGGWVIVVGAGIRIWPPGRRGKNGQQRGHEVREDHRHTLHARHLVPRDAVCERQEVLSGNHE